MNPKLNIYACKENTHSVLNCTVVFEYNSKLKNKYLLLHILNYFAIDMIMHVMFNVMFILDNVFILIMLLHGVVNEEHFI